MRIVDPKWNLLEFFCHTRSKSCCRRYLYFLNKSTKEEILKRTGDKLQEPFDEKIRPGFETMQA